MYIRCTNNGSQGDIFLQAYIFTCLLPSCVLCCVTVSSGSEAFPYAGKFSNQEGKQLKDRSARSLPARGDCKELWTEHDSQASSAAETLPGQVPGRSKNQPSCLEKTWGGAPASLLFFIACLHSLEAYTEKRSLGLQHRMHEGGNTVTSPEK